jgi:hypothetical protein
LGVQVPPGAPQKFMEETTSKEAKVFQLVQDLDDMRNRKKQSAKAFNEEIKRIQAEIKELIDPPAEEELP